jgi:hypothetical protein
MNTKVIHDQSLAMGSAWAKLGWRWNPSQPPFFIDPLIAELRGYQNNANILAGESYRLFNIGPRVLFYLENPNFYFSLFVTRSVNIDRNPSYNISPNWILLSFGGAF